MIRSILKLLYVGRKKIQGLVNRYLEFETKVVHKGRIQIGDRFYFTVFPTFHFDQSNSFIILKDKVSIRGLVAFNFYDNGQIIVGENTFINNGCTLNSLGKIVIGDNCLIGENVKMYDHNHCYRSTDKLIRNQGYNISPITIGDNCWLGANVTILKGVTIGNNSVVGANCLIVKDVPPNSLVVSGQEYQKVSIIGS